MAQTVTQPDKSSLVITNEPDVKKVYIPEWGFAVDTQFNNPDDIRFATQTQVFKEDRDNFFALSPLGKNTNLTKEANGVFDQVRRGAVSGVVNIGENSTRALAYSGYMGLNVLENVYKNLQNKSIDIAQETVGIKEVDTDANKAAIKKEFSDKQQYILKSMELVKNRNQDILQRLRLSKETGDKMPFDIAAGFGSMAAALGIAALTGGSTTGAAAFFGAAAGMSSYDEALDNGLTPLRAASAAVGVGAGEAALEGLGLSVFLKAIKNKGIKNIIAAVLEEPIQEMAQQLNEELYMQLFGGRKKEVRDTVYDIAYSGLIGLIVGAPMGVGGQIIHRNVIKQGSRTLQETGVDKQTADTIAAKAAAAGTSPQVLKVAGEVIRNAGSSANNIEGDINKNVEIITQAMKEQSLTPENRKFVNDISAQAKDEALQAGLSQEEAALVGKVMTSRAMFAYRHTGILPKDWYEKNKLEIVRDVKDGKAGEAWAIVDDMMEYIESPLAVFKSQKEKDKNSYIVLSDVLSKNINNQDTLVGYILRPKQDGTFLVSTYNFGQADIERHIDGLLAVDTKKAENLSGVGSTQRALSISILDKSSAVDSIEDLKNKIKRLEKKEEYLQGGNKEAEAAPRAKHIDNEGTFDKDNPDIFYQSAAGNKIKELQNKEAKTYLMHEKINKTVAKKVFKEAGAVENKDIGLTLFPGKSVGKLLRHKGFDIGTIIKNLPDMYEDAVLLASFPERESTDRAHKSHNNIEMWHNLVNKVKINDENYYIRFTVQEMKANKKTKEKDKYLHSAFVSDVSIYKETGEVLDSRNNLRRTLTPVDNILKDIFGDVNEKFEQAAQTFPRARISFESERAIITLLKSSDKSSIVHELGHLFLKDIERISKISDDEKFFELKRKIDEYLKVEYDAQGNALYGKAYSAESGEMSASPHEKFANAFVAYVKTGRAPNSALKRIFIMFRDWIKQIKDALVDNEEANLQVSPEMFEVFNELLAPMDFERTSYSLEEREELEKVIKDIKAGKDIEISGQKLDEIRNYINQINQRRPKAPKQDLLYYIKRLGVKETFPLIDKAKDAGIKIIKPYHPNYREALGEDNLQEFLTGLEFLQISGSRDSELNSIGADDLQTQSLNMIEKALDGKRVDSADNLSKIEAIEDYDRNIEAINELFGGNLAEAEKVIEMIDELADKNFAVISYAALENLQELARRVEKQNEALGKGAKIENIEASVIRDKAMIKNKKEMIQKKEKDLKKKAAELAKKEKAADKKINIKAEKKKIEKARKEIKDGKQHIKETIEKMKATEKSLADERKLYGDIKAALDAIVAKNKDIGKKINKKNINDAIAENNRAKLLDAVNDALIEIEQMLEGTPDYIDSQKKYVNPSILIAEKKKALLETAKQRIADKKDATGYRMALRTALSGIPHFSNVKVESPVDRKSKLMVAKEYVLDDWTKIKSWQELVDNLDAIFRQVESKSRAKYQEVMKEAIKKEISKNIWVKKGRNKIGRYSDQINDFFKELQEIWEADPKELAARLIASNSALDDIANIESDNAYYKITNTEIIKNRLMNWLLMTPLQRDTKGNILSQELYEMLTDVRRQANKGFDLEQQNARANFKDLRDSLTEEIKSGRMSKGVNRLTKIFTSVEGNWESVINLLFGKKSIKELSILKEQSEADTHIETDLQNFLHKAAKLFGGEKKYRQAYNEMVNKKSKWMDYKLNVEKPGKPEEIELNKAQILTFYIWSKNFDLMKRLLIQFEEPMYDNHGKRIAPPAKNIIAMFNELTPKEKKLGDLIQITAQQYYDSMNEVKRRLTGLELNEQENYFPSVAKQMLSDVDIIQSRMSQIVAPGAIKERSKSDMVRQMPSDPLQILQRHIRIANKYIFEQEKKIKLRKILQDPVLQNAIETAKDIKGNIYFGEDIYIAAKNTIDRISLPKYIERMTATDSFISKIVGNIVKTYIAIKPTIAFKQLIAFVNYSEGIPKDDYLKYIAEFWKNPKAAIKFMAANDFVRARYSQGLANETIQRLTKTDLLTGTNKFNKLLTLNIRLGDAASVVMGGYARVRYHIEKGMSRKEAFDEFELATLRTQQSGQSSALAKWQDNNGNAGLLFSAFRNAQGQYARKIADTYIQMRRGEITPARAAENFMIYSVYNGVFYTLLSLGIADFFDNDDDNKDLASIIVSPVSTIVGALPLLDDAVNVLGQYIIDGKVSFNAKRGDVIGISDFTDWYNSVLGTWFNEKKDLNLDFWINFADFPVRAGLGLPLKTFVNQLAGIKEAVTGEDVAKGFLRALGYTEYRAKKMLGK